MSNEKTHSHLRAVDPDAAVSGTGTMRQFLDAWLGHGPGRLNPSHGAVMAAAAFLMGVKLMAAWLPARRAARIEPTLALKAQ